MTEKSKNLTVDEPGTPEVRSEKPRSRWIALGLTTFTLTMILALVFGLNAGTRLGSRYTPLLDAIFHVKLNITTAHLWFEEAISGDTNESIDDVRSYLDTAEEYIRYSLAGQVVDRLPLTLLSEPDLKSAFGRLHDQVRQLRSVTEERWELFRAARPGSELDESYDELFRNTIALADEIEAGLEASIVADLESFRRVQIALIIASAALFVFTLWLVRRQINALRDEIDHRRRTEINLKRSEAMALAARDEAAAANQAKSLFLAKISHEIRTPISAVMGMASMLSDTALSAEQREYTRIIQTSSNDLLEIINDLLDFSKIEAGKLTLAPVAFDLRRTVADVADLMNLKAKRKHVMLCADIQPDFPDQVIGDPVRIRQILLNLLRNAVKFTSEGRILVALEGSTPDPHSINVRISVSDTGIGIPADKLDRIFDAFSQVDDSSRRKYGGTGLGLSICRQIAELMNGDMGVESEPGHGTRIWVDLPLQIGAAASTPEPLLKDGKPARILLVDADRDNAVCTSRYLQRFGVRYEIVTEPEIVLQSLQNAADHDDPYSALVVSQPFDSLDLSLLCRRIRNERRLEQTGIMVLVMSPSPGLAKRYAECGINGIATQAQRALVLRDMLEKSIADAGAPDDSPAVAAGLGDERVEPSAAPRRPQFRARVLLVEDNPVTQWAAKHMLSNLGCRVDVASSGEEALQQWARNRYDIIFMDWQMPDMDGIDVTNRIREQETPGIHTPIVAVTANAMRGDREKCLAAGMDDYLSKPVQPEGLQRVLEEYLAPSRRIRSIGV